MAMVTRSRVLNPRFESLFASSSIVITFLFCFFELNTLILNGISASSFEVYLYLTASIRVYAGKPELWSAAAMIFPLFHCYFSRSGCGLNTNPLMFLYDIWQIGLFFFGSFKVRYTIPLISNLSTSPSLFTEQFTFSSMSTITFSSKGLTWTS